MATRSTIGILKKDGTIEAIYCHNDGYFSYNGLILGTHYKDYNRVKELISLGSMSSLGKHISPQNNNEHNFDQRQQDVCVFYHRDRKEDLSVYQINNIEEYLKGEYFEEYNYIFKEKNNKWYFEKNHKLIPLHSELKKLNNDEYNQSYLVEKEKKKIISERKTISKELPIKTKKDSTVKI